MKKIINKILLSVLVLCELFNTTTVYALTKDETVYAKLKENGEINSVSISEHLYNFSEINVIRNLILSFIFFSLFSSIFNNLLFSISSLYLL